MVDSAADVMNVLTDAGDVVVSGKNAIVEPEYARSAPLSVKPSPFYGEWRATAPVCVIVSAAAFAGAAVWFREGDA